jgi:Cu/Ag efflux protein CusF
MKKIALLTAAMLTLAIAACSRQESAPPATTSDTSMAPMTTAPAASGPVAGVGTVLAVDASAGTVTLDHEAISAISWPAMQMQFQAADPAILRGLNVGDHVAFELKSATETGIVTSIHRQ